MRKSRMYVRLDAAQRTSFSKLERLLNLFHNVLFYLKIIVKITEFSLIPLHIKTEKVNIKILETKM